MSSVSWPLKADHVENYVEVNRVFSAAQCNELIRIGKSRRLKKAVALNNKKIRDSKISFLAPDEIEWAYAKMADMILEINDRFFKFDLWGFGEGFQFTEYESPHGKYDQHIDKLTKGILRKLSVVVQLTDQNEYEGGDLELIMGPEAIKTSRARGDVIVFPSYILHRVTPLTRGARHSLVAWLSGPAFK